MRVTGVVRIAGAGLGVFGTGRGGDGRGSPCATCGCGRLARQIRRLARDQRGAASVWALFWTMMMMIVSGFTLDVANAYRIRTLLQATADASALAAARQLPDGDAARQAARDLSRINMPVADHGEVSPLAMIEIGGWDADSQSFVSGDPASNAVRVTAARGAGAGLPVPTFLVGLVGREEWHVAASSTARARSGGSGQLTNLCPGALILSADTLQAGGSNELKDGVCLHGQNGVHFGGGDWFDPDSRVSAFDEDTIYIGSVRHNSATRAEVIAESDLAPVIVPELPAMFDTLWSTLFNSSISAYGGSLLPDFIKDPATGMARIVRVNQWWWTVQPGDLEPYTIYMVNHGMQLAGGVDAQNVAIIANGQIGDLVRGRGLRRLPVLQDRDLAGRLGVVVLGLRADGGRPLLRAGRRDEERGGPLYRGEPDHPAGRQHRHHRLRRAADRPLRHGHGRGGRPLDHRRHAGAVARGALRLRVTSPSPSSIDRARAGDGKEGAR